jgi:hypothetical protein
MKLSEYLAQEGNLHKEQGNPSVKCNALSKTGKSFNCYLKPGEAIEFARHLLTKAQLILDNQIEDGVVHVWNVGGDSESVSFGLNTARKVLRRKKHTGPADAEATEDESVSTPVHP